MNAAICRARANCTNIRCRCSNWASATDPTSCCTTSGSSLTSRVTSQAGSALSLGQALADAAAFEPSAGVTARQVEAGVPLSAREREVAALLAEGCSNRDIAERLVVSERTAENHVQHVLNRLGLRSRAQVAAWAIRNGLSS